MTVGISALGEMLVAFFCLSGLLSSQAIKQPCVSATPEIFDDPLFLISEVPLVADQSNPTSLSSANQLLPRLLEAKEPWRIWEEPASWWDRLPAGRVATPDKDVWREGDGLQLPLAGSLFVFGQVRNDSALPACAGSKKVNSGPQQRTISVRSPRVSLQPNPVSPTFRASGKAVPSLENAPPQSQWLRLGVEWRWSLAERVGLECQGGACPALNPAEHDLLDQDLRLVFSVGRSGRLQLGVRYLWENSNEARLGTEATQLYGSVRLAW
jgi:hypothetical protein